MTGNQVLPPGPLLRARFLERPNRFLVRCDIEGLGFQEVFLPNPGRLWELLLPGAPLYVVPSDRLGHGTSAGRKTKYTVLAVERDGRPVFLHTHLTNSVARFLIERGLIPALADARVVRAEYTVGSSRFDFLLRQGRRQVLLEVKSCTLYGNGVAMFPDAVTERGRRHLAELAALGARALRPCVLFLIHTPDVRWFMPDYHTDLAFSRTLLEVRRQVKILPIAIEWTSELAIGTEVKPVSVPWRYLEREVEDRGSYLLVLRLDHERPLPVGHLGQVRFQPGYYVYVGSAMGHLKARVARHLRRRKSLRWHIDHLRAAASTPIALPIRSSARLECDVARSLGALLEPGPRGFGSSDCDCPTHLFWHPTNPLEWSSFHTLLQHFRMRAPTHC